MKFLSKSFRLLVVSLALIVFGVANAGVDMKPGLYEMTMSVNMPGMPAMPPRTQQLCLTEADLAEDPAKAAVPSTANGMPGECSIVDQNQSGNTITWTMRCTGANAMDGEGTTTFAGDSFTSQVKMSGDFMGTGQTMSMTQNSQAKRIADCSESSIPRQ